MLSAPRQADIAAAQGVFQLQGHGQCPDAPARAGGASMQPWSPSYRDKREVDIGWQGGEFARVKLAEHSEGSQQWLAAHLADTWQRDAALEIPVEVGIVA